MKTLTARFAACLTLSAMVPHQQTALSAGVLDYCNAVQSRVGFLRYPFGTTGIWSTEFGEIADVMTRVPRIYPCVDTIVVKSGEDDWRSSVTGDPSLIRITYKFEKTGSATCAEITATRHVSVFRYTFLERTHQRNIVMDFGKLHVEGWAALGKWTERKVRRIDDRTFHATIGPPGEVSAYVIIQFDTPSRNSGTIDPAGNIHAGGGEGQVMYAQFDSLSVTAAVSESFTGFDTAREHLASEFTDFDSARRECRDAWEKALGRIEIDGSENDKRMAYTALYSICSNIISADDGSCYAKFCQRPTSVSSSAFWQFIGGYQSCAFDNSHAAYPFLMMTFPEVMTDVLDTYLARYKRDGVINDNACLYMGPIGDKFSVRYTPVVAATALASGIDADYPALYAALKDNYHDSRCVPASLAKRGYLIPSQDTPFPVSRTLELAAASECMALLAKDNRDPKEMRNYLLNAGAYRNLWDRENHIFRIKDKEGKWGTVDNQNWTWNPNPQGLFEGTNLDYSFCVPHDPYGLLGLPGQDEFAGRMIDYCLEKAWFNDFSYGYPYLLYYAGAAGEAQKMLRKSWIPLFKDGIMYENVCAKPPHNGWNEHYTSNSAWLLCSMIGLYPVQSPPGQYIITSPSVSRTAARCGEKTITVRAMTQGESDIYIRSIRLDGKNYPCYMIPARRLLRGASIELDMGSDPMSKLGNLFISSSDGYVEDAELPRENHLKCTIVAAGIDATTKIFCATPPVKITVNGSAFRKWNYDEIQHTTTLKTKASANIEVLLN